MPITKLEGKETLVSTCEEDKGKWLNFNGNSYYVVKDNEDFKIVIQNGTSLSSLITTYVTDMKRMVKNLENPETFNEPLNTWDVSNVKDMSYMFNVCSSFNQPLDEWDVSKVKDMYRMFYDCSSFNQPLDSWNVSNVKDMSWMFEGCSSFNQPLDSWNVSNVEYMHSMFSFCSSFNQPLNSWNVYNVRNMEHMFSFCSSFNQPLDSWNVSNVKDMEYMFKGCISFNQPLSYDFIQKYTQSNKNNYYSKPLIEYNQYPLTIEQVYRLQLHMKEVSTQFEKIIKEFYNYKKSTNVIIHEKMHGFCKELIPHIISFCV